MLSVNDIDLIKAQRRLLADISFQLPAGQLLGVIGPNGAGKSSLLKVLAGLWPANGGCVSVDDIDVAAQPRRARSETVAWLAQQNSVAFDFSVEQVVGLGAQRSQAVVMAEAMQLFGVSQLATRGIAELSGGQQQRVHLARVFSQLNASPRDSQCLLLDEPLNGLDLRWQQRCLAAVKSWLPQRPQRHAVVAIHDIGLAATVCDQVLVLNEGMIEFMGDAADLTESLLASVWRYPLTIQREQQQTLVYAKV